MKKKIKELPLFELIVNEEDDGTSVFTVSLVTDPAIELGWKVFSDDKLETRYQFSEENDEYIITGPAMVPNTPILRKDPNSGEYFNVFFSEESVKSSMISFMKEGATKESNINHENEFFEGINIIESWIKIDDNDKSTALGYTDIPNGSWFVSMKVDSEEIWKSVMSEEITGFSVEGLFLNKAIEMSKLETKDGKDGFLFDAVETIINSNISDENKYEIIKGILK